MRSAAADEDVNPQNSSENAANYYARAHARIILSIMKCNAVARVFLAVAHEGGALRFRPGLLCAVDERARNGHTLRATPLSSTMMTINRKYLNCDQSAAG